MVSVKSNGAGDATPPVPNVDYGRFGNGPASPAFSVGSTFLNSANAATQAKPQIVRVGSTKSKQESVKSVSRDSNAITIIDDTPPMEQGPFSDKQAVRQQSRSSLGAVAEEGNDGLDRKKKETTPFGDENEVKEK